MLVFDRATDELIVPSAAGGLLAVDPTAEEPRSILPIPSNPMDLAIDPDSGRLFVSAYGPSSVAVYGAKSYVLRANISIPHGCNGCGSYANDAQLVLFDAAHGDAYLLGLGDFFTLNLSSLAIVSMTLGYGSEPFGSAAYAPSGDRIFGTFLEYEVFPGFLVQLAHGNPLMVSRLLWLPTALGTLALAMVIGSALALLQRRRALANAKQSGRDPSLLERNVVSPSDRSGRSGCAGVVDDRRCAARAAGKGKGIPRFLTGGIRKRSGRHYALYAAEGRGLSAPR